MNDGGTDLIGKLAEEARPLRSRIIEAVRRHAEVTHRAADPHDAEDLEFVLDLLLRRVGGGGTATAADDRRLADIGTALAGRGYRPGELAAAYQVPLRAVIDHVRELGGRFGCRPAHLLDTVDLVLEVCNTIASAVAGGYHAAEHHRQRAEFLRALLHGVLDTDELDRQVRRHGLDPEREYLAFRARTSSTGATIDDLAGAFGLTFGPSHGDGLCAVVGADLVGFVGAAPLVDVPGVAGIGPPRPPARLAGSFRMAARALDTAERRGLTGAQRFSELGLLPAMGNDSAVGEALCRRYLAPLGDSESAAELADTLHVYLAEGMNVARTARRKFVHPNTVRYRIGRFEELADVSLRSSSEVVFEVLWALECRAARQAHQQG
ncbi:MAG TPA: helix-turn-helix domain-containing protein [Pseudonocardiaceae bacterium]